MPSEDQDTRADILDLSRQARIAPLTPWFEAQLDQQIAAGLFPGLDEIASLRDDIVEKLVAYAADTGVHRAVIGMSGGVDSALTAALLKAAGWEVHGFTLPIRQNSDETERGIEACRKIEISHTQIELSAAYHDMLKHLDADFGGSHEGADKATRIRRGNLRARIRMMALYDQAHRLGGLVASTDNFSELTAGFWTLHGDVGDLSPIQAVTKSWEVPALSRLAGVPEAIWRATPTDGLGIDAGDEAQLGATYLEWDIMLFARIAACKQGAGALDFGGDDRANAVDAAQSARMRGSWFKRAGSICLSYPGKDRYGDLELLDRARFVPPVMRRI